MIAPRTPRRSGVTLTELLVVIAIILLLSAATLPTAYVTFAERAVSEGASIVQANLSMTRDRAAGTGQPQGVRFLPDPDLSEINPLNPDTNVIVSNRMLTLTTPPNYSEGRLIPVLEIFEYGNIPIPIQRLAVYGAKFEFIPINNTLVPIPLSPTSWYFNIRQGERLRIGSSGTEFTIAGPITLGPLGNPERYTNQTINLQPGGQQIRALPLDDPQYRPQFEVLYLVNGRDDNNPQSNWPGVGYVDATFDGISNNGDTFPDPGYDGIDNDGQNGVDDPRELLLYKNPPNGPNVYNPMISEYEPEQPTLKAFEYVRYNGEFMPGGPFAGYPRVYHRDDVNRLNPIALVDPRVRSYNYTIFRRPSVAQDSREYTLPGGAVIDLTTSNLGSFSERSRVPIDPVTGYVDLVFFPDGRVIPSTPYGLRGAKNSDYPFYFLWIAAREDIYNPQVPTAPNVNLLPVPRAFDPAAGRILEGYRRLVTISPNSAHSSVSEISEFNPSNINAPYAEAFLHQQTGR